MKSKFISVILTVAVCLGLLLVPAMGVSVSAADPGAGKAAFQMPAVKNVDPGATFLVDVTIYNPHSLCMTWAALVMEWDDALLSLNDVTDGDWTLYPAGLKWPQPWNTATDNFTMQAGQLTPGTYQTGTITHCTINFTAANTEGNATVRFSHDAGEYGGEYCYISDPSGEVQDWSAFQNMTVNIGIPKLKVDVVGNGTVTIGGVGTPTSYPNTTNQSWDDSVSLLANPDAGWEFHNWTGDITGPAGDASSYVNITDFWNNVTANFVEKPPEIAVSTNDLDFTGGNGLRQGDNTANDTVVISNTGGGLLNWTASRQGGSAPTWAVNDTWTWMEFYSMLPDGTPYPNPNWTAGWGVNDTPVVMAVTGESGSNYTGIVDFVYDAQRSVEGGLVATMYNATVKVDKATLDNVEQLANMKIKMGSPPDYTDVQALVEWDYAPSPYGPQVHGWPYYPGKIWFYNVTKTILAGGFPVPGMTDTTTCMAVVTGTQVVSTPMGDFTCWVIGHVALPTYTAFKEVYWSDDAKNFVLDVDGGTYDAPPPYIRSLVDMSPPAWLRIDPLTGSLATGESEPLTATVYSAGLAVGEYNTTFTISGSDETVNVTLEVLPATTTNVMRNLPGNAMELNQTWPGDTFDVYVNFTAPFNQMNAISLTDLAPDGWEVAVDAANCTADGTNASYVKATGNKVEVTWWGDPNVGFAVDTNFSAKYQVTVPETANPGINEWPLNDGSKAWVEYYEGMAGPYTSNVTDEYQMMITVPGYATGETRDVNANPLPDTTVVLENGGWAGSDASTPDYSIECRNTGVYWLKGIKDAYYTVETLEIGGHPIHNANHTADIDWSTADLLANSYHVVDGMNVADLDFEGDYGLVPQSCTMSYAMKSVNLYVFSPAPVYDIHNGVVTAIESYGLSQWKAVRSVMSWQNPYHPTP